MQTSIAPVSTSGKLPKVFAAITEARFAGVEKFGHGFLVHVVASTEVGQPVREQGPENALIHPFRDSGCMPEPHHRLLTQDAGQ